jgi:hypothetical protein
MKKLGNPLALSDLNSTFSKLIIQLPQGHISMKSEYYRYH